MKKEIIESKDGQWYCILKARNGQVLFTSETYKNKRSILKVLKKYFPDL